MPKRPVLTILLIVAGLLGIFFGAQTYLSSQKTFGTFEFVRRGEGLLDKGHYKKALSYFEKAYEASPMNAAVKLDLVYAYSEYAKALAVKNDLDTAITHLRRAYEVSPDVNTARNLGSFYIRKAVAELRKGDEGAATALLAEMRELAVNVPEATQALSVAAYNDAAEEYRAGRDEAASAILEGSILMYDEPRTLEFLGDIYYRRTDLGKAQFFWAKALKAGGDEKKLSADLEKISKEILLKASEEQKELSHFNIRYDKDLPLDTRLVNVALEKAYQDIGADLGYFPAEKTTVFFYSKEDFVNIFKLPAIVGAFYDGNIRMPLPEGRLSQIGITRYIVHEYTHVAVTALTKGNCQPWFNEGVAMWEEYKGHEDEIKKIFPRVYTAEAFSIRELDKALKSRIDASHDIRPYYLAAYTLVKFIVDTWGVESLKGILQKMSTGEHVINAIDDQLLLSPEKFEARWLEDVKKTYQDAP